MESLCSHKRLFQALDFKGGKFCLPDEQFVKTRMKPGISGCQGEFVHKVIHNVCG
jgi:hypothetical protein